MKTKQNVLIVDDDALCIFLAEAALKNHFHIHSVSNGHKALEAVEKKKYDIILMDINLGDERMDGIRTMRMIKQEKRHKYIKVLAVTSFTHTTDWYAKQGFDGVYAKPIIEEQIVEVIRETLNSEYYRYLVN